MTIESNGAILMGANVVCDAHWHRPIRIVTHAHLDHIWGLEQSINECDQVLMTPATRDLIEIIKSKSKVGVQYIESLHSTKIRSLEYGKTFTYGGEKITLETANHIIGSAQVLVESAERIVYTGDFRLKGIPVIPADILIMEATYGNPCQRRKFKEEVESRLIDLIAESLKSGKVYIFGYYGKLQEVLELIHKAGLSSPVIMPEKLFKMTKICEKYGMKLGKYFSSELAKELDSFIALYHMGAERWIPQNGIRILLSGWEFNKPIRQTKENEWIVAFSDHADFDELMQYVEQSRPKFVITDNKRVGDAITLAKEITKRFGIPAKPMP